MKPYARFPLAPHRPLPSAGRQMVAILRRLKRIQASKMKLTPQWSIARKPRGQTDTTQRTCQRKLLTELKLAASTRTAETQQPATPLPECPPNCDCRRVNQRQRPALYPNGGHGIKTARSLELPGRKPPNVQSATRTLLNLNTATSILLRSFSSATNCPPRGVPASHAGRRTTP